MSITKSITNLGRPVAYYPELARFLGGVNEALIVGAFLHWSGGGPDKIQKSCDEIEIMTELSYKQQHFALMNLAEKGYVKIIKKSNPVHYCCCWYWDKLMNDFNDYMKGEK